MNKGKVVAGIDVADVTRKMALVKFAPRPAASEQKQQVAQTEEDRLLDEGENQIFQGHYAEAKIAFQSVLERLDPKSERALYGLGGLLSILLGVVLFARPHLGAVALAEVFGLFSLAYGATSLVLAARTHDAGDALSHALS